MAIAGRDPVKRILGHFDFLIHAPKRELIKATMAGACIAGLGLAFSSAFGVDSKYGVFYDFSENRCMPEYFYIGLPKAPVLHRGDMVSFVTTDKTMLGLFVGNRMAKIIKGVPGDLVISNEEGVFVNGQRIAERSPLTLAKMELKHITPVNMNRKLQPGELFVMGTLPRSFDSRYWGVLPAADVERMVKAIF